MKHYKPFILTALLALLLFAGQARGIDIKDTRMLHQPALSSTHIAFIYAGDLWVMRIGDTMARRLTSDEGQESNPAFSPDGSWIAFSAEYDGNKDVYLIPMEGGIPKRLTWHPGPDEVRGFTPDGRAVLFISQRSLFTNRFTQLFTVPIQGGFPENLGIPNANRACYSPDGKHLVYTPLGEAFHQWKRYRGGMVSRLWIYSFADRSVREIPQPEGYCNDTDPMWIGDRIYFRSDRSGEFNLFFYDMNSKEILQVTQHEDFPVLYASSGGSRIIYAKAGRLHLYDPNLDQDHSLTIGAAADLQERRPRYVKGSRYIRSAAVSPSGKRAVFGFRGEIVTVPAEKGDPRNLTLTPGIHERYPAWSPDGKRIAFFSDASGEYALHLQARDGKGEIKVYPLQGAGFYDTPQWSPDGKKISFSDNSWSLHWIDLETGKQKKIASEYLYGPQGFKNNPGSWSPDSRWIAYTLNTAAYIQKVYVYSLEEDKSYPVTDGLSDVAEPVFDAGGKYLYFLASTDAGPVKHWFDLSNVDMRLTRSLYLVVLRKDLPSPLAKENDEETIPAVEKPDQGDKPPVQELVRIDFEGLNEHVLALPLPAAQYFSLLPGEAGKIYFLEAVPANPGERRRNANLHFFDIDTRKDKILAEKINSFKLSADTKKLLFSSGESWGIVDSGSPFKPTEGKLSLNEVQVRIDPPVEWRQIFEEAWRVNRDFFYDPNMHGVDWNAMRRKYAVFLPHLACRSDLNQVIQWMCSELSVGHHRVGGGDYLIRPERVGGGLLGADFTIENKRYRFKKIYGGLNWNPDLRSPLTEPGVDVKAGEYLLAVQGTELSYPANLFSLFENTAGKITEITVGPNPDGSGSRTVAVVPLTSEYALRNRDWVEGNLKKVDEATNGRVAYVYVPNTSTMGHTYFKRYFFPQSDKDAIIVDERFNGGGMVADYYIDLLRRPYICHWGMRYGADLKSPSASIQGPKVMLIDETAGSGGDLLPWMFRKFNLGKLIGKRTWGGLVGVLGFPMLMDGGYVTAPNLGIWHEGKWVVENIGISPDIVVEQLPDQVMDGKDPQLEKAIEEVLKELEQNPPKKYQRPPYPIR